jgi:hypothetical protein
VTIPHITKFDFSGNRVFQELIGTVRQPYRCFPSALRLDAWFFKPPLLLPEKTTDFFCEFEQFLK